MSIIKIKGKNHFPKVKSHEDYLRVSLEIKQRKKKFIKIFLSEK